MKHQLKRTVPAVLAGALVGGLGVRPTSRWYRQLDKPSWNPPNAIFGPAWTTIYALTATGSARALERADARQRRETERALWLNMALNAGWCWLFFTAERPRLALAEILVLDASTVDLARRLRDVDPAAGRLLAPYVVWNTFATALNAEIVRRNR